MSTKELIDAIEEKAYLREPHKATKDELKEADVWLNALHLINEAMEGKVIVPVDLILNIDLLTEAGFSAEEQIDELCELLVQDGDSHES